MFLLKIITIYFSKNKRFDCKNNYKIYKPAYFWPDNKLKKFILDF